MDYFEMERNKYNSQNSGSLGISGRITPIIKAIIISNLAVFFIDAVLEMFFNISLSRVFGLVPYRFIHNVFIWQIVSYMFLHSGIFHIFWNLLGLWMFGADVEKTMGSRSFCIYYFAAGIFAGLCAVLFNYNSLVPTIGASGAIFGILAAFGLLFPEREITLLIFLILPVRAKAKYIVMGFGILTFFQSMLLPGDQIAHIAHLGGLLFGVLYFKNVFKLQTVLETITEKILSLLHSHPHTNASNTPHCFEKEIDAILDKISREGIHSLTKKERTLLNKARNKFN
ncbi:rhomboid family intramembrane serine protease [bacterium]|nr:rhomboid family intramembrane serine protease [bacterium]MCP5462347.1 rhomboid family intramembrane serine protease [bacterium]